MSFISLMIDPIAAVDWVKSADVYQTCCSFTAFQEAYTSFPAIISSKVVYLSEKLTKKM